MKISIAENNCSVSSDLQSSSHALHMLVREVLFDRRQEEIPLVSVLPVILILLMNIMMWRGIKITFTHFGHESRLLIAL